MAARRNEVDRTIEKVEHQIAALQQVLALLYAERQDKTKPKQPRARPAPVGKVANE